MSGNLRQAAAKRRELNSISNILLIFFMGIAVVFGDELPLSETVKKQGEDAVRRRMEEFIHAICGQDLVERQRMLSFLSARPSWCRRLQPYSMELIPCLSDYEASPKSALVLACLNLPPSLAEKLLKTPHLPNYLRGRLGDKEAERQVIQTFEGLDAEGKRGMASQLLFMETTNAFAAFGKALESRECFTSRSEYGIDIISQAAALLLAYGDYGRRFALDREWRAVRDEEEFQQKEFQDYLRKIEKYFLEKHGLKIHITAPFLFKLPEPPPWDEKAYLEVLDRKDVRVREAILNGVFEERISSADMKKLLEGFLKRKIDAKLTPEDRAKEEAMTAKVKAYLRDLEKTNPKLPNPVKINFN